MALHFIGKVDTKEEMLVLNEMQEQAVLRTLLQKRDPRLYREIYGLKNVREVTGRRDIGPNPSIRGYGKTPDRKTGFPMISQYSGGSRLARRVLQKSFRGPRGTTAGYLHTSKSKKKH